MEITNSKKLVCITGNVWTGSRDAPRRLLVNHGFVRPTWFTTRQHITDAEYRHIPEAAFHLARMNGEILASMDYHGDFMGIMHSDLALALDSAEIGALVVGPQEIAAQIAAKEARAILFTFKDSAMERSRLLDDAERNGQLHRIDVDMLQPGAWNDAYHQILKVIGL
ncbi:MAG: hypothetical protein KDI63_11835 [Gammaproteobacteria bacterium]|nr:hypothetical protein [Gammaproteobacteria bacterium]